MANLFKCVFIYSPFFFMVLNCKSQNDVAGQSFKILHVFFLHYHLLLSVSLNNMSMCTSMHTHRYTYSHVYTYI